MANASVGGLVSGLDTASIISQLMQVEAQSQTRIKSRMATEQSNVKSLQDLNSKLAALTTAAGDLAKPAGWSTYAITSSSDKVSVTAGAATTPGSVSFTVGHLAQAHQLSFTNTAALTDVVTTGSNNVRLDFLDGNTLDVNTTDGTLQGLVTGINAANTGVKASTVKLDDGTYRLRVTSTSTGLDSDFTLKNVDGSDLLGAASVTAGMDAEITVGADTIHSSTNTFAGSVNGLSITLKQGLAPATVVDLTVTPDASATKAKVKSLVESINAALTQIDTLASYNATTKTSGALAGDSAIRTVRNSLLTAIYPTGGGSMADVGVQTDRYGKLVFDETKFDAAYAADPVAVSDAFSTNVTTGFAARVQAVAKGASDSIDGTVTQAINGRNTSIERMKDSIADWDNRLALRQSSLTRQFAALETALQKVNAQSSWLEGALPKTSSS